MSLPAGFVPPCIPTPAAKPPAGPNWVHGIKNGGHHLQVCRAGTLVRLFTRCGFDSSGRYFAISAASSKLAAESFRLDEALMCEPLAH
jgi:bifunctional non-homologous end joining protein LigD